MPYHRIGPDEAKALIRRFQGDSFYVLDKDCQFVDMGDGCFNDPALKGKTKDDFIGKIIWELIPDSKGSNFYYQALKVLTTGESVHFEHRCISAPDFHYMVHMFPLDDGILLYFFNISSKIDLLNHLKVSNERLKFLNDELKQFMFYLQHDLRNPLNVIQALTSCIALDPSNVLSNIHIRIEQGQKWRALVKKITAGEYPYPNNDFEFKQAYEFALKG